MIGLDELKSYTQRGWAVFPCHSIVDGACSCGRPACDSPGKHPRTLNGVKAATSDMNQVRAWLDQWPDANWAVGTGEGSGVWVLDLDAKPNQSRGEDSLRAWLAESHATMYPTFTVASGGGGWHYYYKSVPGLRNRTGALEGVDAKSDGGYVLLPGSNHVSGGTYRIERDAPVAQADERLVELARRSAPKTDLVGSPSGSLLDPIPEGERDDTLFRMACALRRKLNDDRPAIEALVVQRAIASGFSEADALRKVQSAFEQDHSDLPLDLFREDRPRLNLRSAREVRSMPKPRYVVEGVLPEGALFQVFGQTGSYKSFVMLDLLASVANGFAWMGHEVNASGPVAFVLGEGGYDAGLRFDAWMIAHPDASESQIVYSIEEQLDLMDDISVDGIVADLEVFRLSNFPDQAWRVIVFDTQADHMPSGDEDKSRDFTVVKRNIQRIAHETGAAVGLVHHTGWDDSRERGSSRQRQALDVVMQVKAMEITNIKQKAGPKFEPIQFQTQASGDSIIVQKRNPMQAASQDLDAELERGRDVITYLADHPGASGNEIQRALGLGRSGTWPTLRDLLAALGYIEAARDSSGKVTKVRPTALGFEYYGIEGAP